MVKLRMFWLWALVLVAMVACEQTRDAPPRIATPVTDNAGVLSDADEAALATRLAAHRQRTGVQVALLTITTLNGEPIEDFSHRTAVAWGGGSRERNDGVLVTLAIRDHRSRIEVGYGLEAELPDGRTRGMLDGARPFLRRSDYAGAFGSILDGIETHTAGRRASGDGLFEGAPQSSAAPVVTTAPAAPSDSGGVTIVLICLGALAVSGVLVWALVRADRKREREAREHEAEMEREARAQRAREEQARREREARAREAQERREREAREAAAKATPPPPKASPAPTAASTYKTPASKPAPSPAVSSYTGAASLATAARDALQRADTRREDERRAEERRAEERRAAARRDEEERAARRRRQDEEDRRRRREQDEEDDRRRASSSSSSSSWWGSDSSSSSGSSSSSDSSSSWGGGGGDFGGGGSSSDW